MRHKQKELKVLGVATLLTFAFSLSTATAQESINATGGNASGSGGSTSYSVGQFAYQTHIGTSGLVAEGVQQPYEIWMVTGIEEAEGINLSVAVYPNPTNNHLTLEVKDFDLSTLYFQVYDMNGKLLQSEKITINQTSIDMSNLVSGNYFVKVIQDKNIVHRVKSKEIGAKQFNMIKTFKVIKTQ